MDASELDLDAKLYKASATLLSELQYKLPLLLYQTKKLPRTLRLRVLDTKCEELRLTLDRFQEWPQLLDPCLSALVQLLADAFIGYLATSAHHYGPAQRHGTASVSPLPRVICRLLYSFCKVRGYKVIVRLLNNEPKYLALVLSGFQAWNHPSKGMAWEERYIMLLWLSHLMLAPFELANLSVSSGSLLDMALPGALRDLPGIAGDITSLAFAQLDSSGKEREAASILLVRLSLRKDMQALALPVKLVEYANQRLLIDDDLENLSPYKALGLLSLLYGITNAGSDSEVAAYLQNLFYAILKIATAQSSRFVATRNSGPARKWILKILRVILTHGISLNSRKVYIPEDQLNMMLEESIQYFLDALSDKDTPVRMAAAKALSVVTLKLDSAMSTEVVEAVLGCLEENVLLEDPHSHNLIPVTDTAHFNAATMTRNISAVDPLRWHGLMLTLAHLLFRRSPPPSMLSVIIRALILGLEFEQRSNVGTSLGVGVRDAACFGLWALARKYNTAELDLVPMSNFAEARREEFSDCKNVLQLIAIKLTISACLDPSGNIRRGSSAALQELIGRHPDTIDQGISIVQVVDYHAVARLSRAMIEVVPQAAALSSAYQRPLLRALTEWRGARATDVNQRRWASTATRLLTKNLPISQTVTFTQTNLNQLLDLKPANIGSTAAARHGLLLALASGLESMRDKEAETVVALLTDEKSQLTTLDKLTGKLDSRVTPDLELIMEAVAILIGQICQSLAKASVEMTAPLQSWITSAAEVLDHCTVAGGRDIVIQTGAGATVELYKLLSYPQNLAMIEGWLDHDQQSPLAFTSKGRIKTLSLFHAQLAREHSHAETRQKIISYVMDIIEGNYKIETKVEAMEALGVILANIGSVAPKQVSDVSRVLRRGLTDYTNDQRGDIGSVLRLQSLETADLLRRNPNKVTQTQSGKITQDIMPLVVKLAGERLNNVRFKAWKCLESYWQADKKLPALKHTFQYPTDVSSVIYFHQLMHLLPVEWAQKHLIFGLVLSATSGTEDICRAASNAFVAYLQPLDPYTRRELVTAISSILVDEIEHRSTDEDRHVVPFLEFLCFLVDQGLFDLALVTLSECGDGEKERREDGTVTRDLWSLMQKIHGPTSSLARIEASLNVYSRLLTIDTYRSRALDKLTRQLLHRWPKIRNAAADMLYLDSPSQILASCDWNAPVAQTKPVVLELRRQLGVAGNAASKTG